MTIADSIVTFFNAFYDYINTGIYQFFTKAFAELIKWLLLAKIEFLLFIVPFAWDTAKELMITLHISEALTSAWSLIDSRVMGVITYMRLPEAVNLLLSAHLTKFVLKMVGL